MSVAFFGRTLKAAYCFPSTNTPHAPDEDGVCIICPCASVARVSVPLEHLSFYCGDLFVELHE